MADGTKIEWADATLNYVNGCSLESPGCTNCYAMKQAHRFPVRQGLTVKTKGGMVWTGEVRENPKALDHALAWKRGRAIFWNAHGDLFHPSVPDEWIDRQFAILALTPHHRHMVLTKRSARMREYLSRRQHDWPIAWGSAALALHLRPRDLRPDDHGRLLMRNYGPFPLPNVWLGVSVEDQTRADERIPDLLATPAAVRFISAEPLLGPVDLQSVGAEISDWASAISDHGGPNLDWVIAGGESGPGARPMHPDWARSLRDQCAAADVAFHFKQWGEWMPTTYGGRRGRGLRESVPRRIGSLGVKLRRTVEVRPAWQNGVDSFYKAGKKQAGRLLDGVTHDEVPA